MYFLSILEDSSQNIIKNLCLLRHFIFHLDVCPLIVSFILWPFLYVSGPNEQSFLIDAIVMFHNHTNDSFNINYLSPLSTNTVTLLSPQYTHFGGTHINSVLPLYPGLLITDPLLQTVDASHNTLQIMDCMCKM